MLKSVNVRKAIELTPKARKLHRAAVKLRKSSQRLRRRFKTLKRRVSAASNYENTEEYLKKKLNKTTYDFVMSQLSQQKRSPKGRRYTVNEKILGLSLLKQSPKGYALLRKMFALPCRKTLTNLLGTVPFHTGINEPIFNQLKGTIGKMKKLDTYCSILFDEISLQPSLFYNQKQDSIIGFTDNGSSQRQPIIADKAMVFMARGIHKKWKQPLAYYFNSGGMKAPQIVQCLRDVVRAAGAAGLTVVSTVCDQASPNTTAIKMLYQATNREFALTEQENRLFGFSIDQVEIVPLFDIPHLLKGIRNNFFAHTKCQFSWKTQCRKVASWNDIVQLYNLDNAEENQEYRILHKLTESHIKNKKKMKVSYAAQVFSRRVAALLKGISRICKFFHAINYPYSISYQSIINF